MVLTYADYTNIINMEKFRRKMRVLIAIALVLGVWLPTHAHDFEVDGIYYKYIDKTAKTVEVTYRGIGYSSYSNEYTGSVAIPSSVTYSGTTYSVTSIGNGAFYGCTSLTSVRIPDSVTSIGESAFYGCSGLTSASIGNSVKIIWDKAFYGCSSLTSVTIPNSVVTIRYCAFHSCSSLTSVNFGNSVNTIGEGAFYGCTSLTSARIPDSVTSIGESAFYGCSGLTSVSIGNSVTSIDADTFYECTKLSSVTIGKSVTTIAGGAFMYCKNLKNVVFYCPTLMLLSNSFFLYSESKLNLFFCGGELQYMGSSVFFRSSNVTFYVSPSKVEFFKQNYTDYTIKEITSEQIAMYGNAEIVANEYDEEKSGVVSFSGSGSGTESDPFLIFNPVQLNDVRNSVGHSGVYYKLMSDIDMTEWIAENNPQQGWQPIGNLSSMFKGTFIGNGKKITGLTINRSTTDYVGFFGYVHSAKITDLTIEGNIVGNNDTGGIFGKANVTEIDNCRFIGNIKGNARVGGIIGYSMLSDINNTHFSGKITGGVFSGGVIGRADLKPVDSVVITDGCVSGDFNANIKISNVSATCDITSSNNCVGGVVGYLYTSGIVSDKDTGKYYIQYNTSTSLKLTNATHNGSIKANSCVGGIIGKSQIGDNSQSTLDGGNISVSVSLDGCQHIGNISGNQFIGGVIGKNQHWYDYSQNSTTLSNCFSVGDIVSAGGSAAGLIGGCEKASAISNVEVSNCYALGNINSNGNYSGGLFGSIEGGTNSVSDCYFSGAIYGKEYVGGLAGQAKSLSIVTSYSNASSINGESHVGGIAGFVGDGSSIQSCISANEKVNATKDAVGRVYGSISSSATIGTMNTSKENKGLATMIVNKNGVQQLLEDGPQHGTNVGRSTLKLKSTYQGLGWDFTTNWTNQETESYPYKQTQTAPPVFSNSSKAGETTISGKSVKDGTVYVEISNKAYSANVVNNTWSITVDSLQAGATIVAYAKSPNLNESFRISQIVGYIGSGTDEDPYQIHSASDLANVNGGGTYKLMNDIDLNSWIQSNNPTNGWIPLGKNGNVMTKLIGDNHKITGLWCNTTDNNAALIASGSNLTITDLTVEVASGKEVKGGQYTAILVGNATNCTISNCHVKGSINGISHVGGIAGAISDGAVTNSSSDVQISASDSYVGGICGQSTNVDFERCNSKVTASGINYLGGISGISTQVISNCKATATLNGVNYIGGLVGKTTGTIIKSNASCNIEGICSDATEVCYAGGLVGHSSGDITISYSEGSISQDATSLSCYVGGISGYNEGGNIKDCYSTANISSAQYGAGIVGYNTGSLSNCYASGNISATLFGAGIVGYNDGASATTKYCIAANNILEVDSEKGIAMRVIGGIKNNAPTPDTNNYALGTMAVSVNGITQKIYDDVLHGISKTQAVLMQSATYSSLGWDMISIWGITEGNGYPFLYKEKVFASSLSIDREEATLSIGDNITLVATISPADATTKNVKWTSSNEQVAIVDDLGVITAISEGNAVITATTLDGSNLTASCNITVLGKIVNYFVAKDMEVSSGTSFVLPIELVNEDAITGFQCDIYLPDGIEFEMYDDEYDIELANRATSSHILSSALQNDGSVRVLAYSTSSKVFSDNNGTLFNLKLTTSDSFEDNVQIIIKNIVMTTPSEVEFKPTDLTITISKRKYILGDTNNDGVINVTDVVRIANYVLGNEPSEFVFEAADIKADGVINVSDIVGVSNLILNGSSAKTLSVKSVQNKVINEAKLSLEDFVITAGESKEIVVKLDNAEAFTALQLDIELPLGLNIEKATLNKATSSHVMMANELSNGDMRILSYSTQNANFKSTDDALFTLVVKADDNFNGGNIVISDILAVENNMKEAIIDDVVATVSAPCGIEGIYTFTNIYAEDRSIVVESPCQQTIYISTVDGITLAEYINIGKNIIAVNNAGLYIVSTENGTKKLTIK